MNRQAHIITEKTTPSPISSTFRYFTWPQMIAHHTLGGCNLRPGDLLGSGTISGGALGTRGCLLEATSGGQEALHLKPYHVQSMQSELGPSCKGGASEAWSNDGAGDDGNDDEGDSLRRVWLEDGDEVVLRGWCRPREGRIGEAISFGECRGIVLPSHQRFVK